MQTLEQEILRTELVEPVGVYEEDNIEEEVAKEGREDERLTAVLVGQRPGEQGEQDGGGALQHPAVRLGRSHYRASKHLCGGYLDLTDGLLRGDLRRPGQLSSHRFVLVRARH